MTGQPDPQLRAGKVIAAVFVVLAVSIVVAFAWGRIVHGR
jgi:hypothetical protein